MSVHSRELFAACCFLVARKRSIIICKYIAGKFVRGGGGGGEFERVGRRDTPCAASYFINYNEGYTAPSLNIHETQPHLVYAPGTDRTFSRRRPV